MSAVGKAFVALLFLWPVLLAAGLGARLIDRAPWLSAAVYLGSATVCHQNPARSFHTHGVKWPVCARCSGLYLAAPAGALAALFARRPFRRSRELRMLAWLAAPTILTFVLEHGGIAAMSSAVRFAAALPLGAAAAWIMTRMAAGRPWTIE